MDIITIFMTIINNVASIVMRCYALILMYSSSIEGTKLNIVLTTLFFVTLWDTFFIMVNIREKGINKEVINKRNVVSLINLLVSAFFLVVIKITTSRFV